MSAEDFRDLLAQSLVAGLPGPEASPADLALVAEHGLGGVILFSRNVQTPEQVWRLNHDLRRAAQAAGRPPLFMMVDQEGGTVARLKRPFTQGPDLSELGREGDAQALRAHGARLGLEITAAGFNFNLAPVLDVHAVEGGVMARRSLGPDPDRVAELGAAFIEGMQGAGCLACAKHFPGLGRTTADTHRERPRVGLSRAQLEAVELVPFRRAAAAGVAGVMVCHAVYEALDPQRPASLSPLVIEGLLRDRLGYQGLVLSDDLEMGAVAASLSPAQAAVEAYLAGCDLLLICHRAELALEALEMLLTLARRGEIDPRRLRAGARRLARVKSALAPVGPPLSRLQEMLDKP